MSEPRDDNSVDVADTAGLIGAMAAAAAGADSADQEPHILTSIMRLKSRLSDLIEPFELLDQLLSLQFLTRRQYNKIRTGDKAAEEQNEALLDLLTSPDQRSKFLEALRNTGQQHIINLITQRGDIGDDFGDDRPLDEARMRTLNVNTTQLLDRLVTDVSFVTQLATVGCITWRQREHLMSIVQPCDRNDKLLEFLTRRSVAHFNKFISVLAKEQTHLVPLLLTDGVVAGLHAQLEESSVNVAKTEDIIVSQWREISADQQHELRDKFDEILRPLDLQTRLVVVERASSLALCFICMTLSAVMGLRDQWNSGQLRDILQSLFTFLSGAAQTVRVKRLTWPLSDYQRCLGFFGSAQGEGSSSEAVILSTDLSQLSVGSSLSPTKLSILPLEMVEKVLMRAFIMLYITKRSQRAERDAFVLLASVCWNWRQTLVGWLESPTRHWLKHQLKKLIERSCRPYRRTVQFNYMYEIENDREVAGVIQLHDVVYVVCHRSLSILTFNATTHQRLTEIVVKDLRSPWDIVACQQTSQLYVADSPYPGDPCIWRVSTDGTDIKRWLPKSPSDTFKPFSLSVTSTRLLMTSQDPHQLIQFDSVGDELRRVQLPRGMAPRHAVESPTGSFIVSLYNRQLNQGQVVEVNNVGEVLREISGSRLSSLSYTGHIAVDSQGHILVADQHNRRILLLDSQLNLRRTIIDEHQQNNEWPQRLCYNEQSGQLLVGLVTGVVVFDVLCR